MQITARTTEACEYFTANEYRRLTRHTPPGEQTACVHRVRLLDAELAIFRIDNRNSAEQHDCRWIRSEQLRHRVQRTGQQHIIGIQPAENIAIAAHPSSGNCSALTAIRRNRPVIQTFTQRMDDI